MNAVSRRLLFRIGEVGFSINLEELVEVCEQVAGRIDPSRVDPERHVIGALPFRRTLIPVVDLAQRLAIDLNKPAAALVLSSSEGNWALPVSQVLGFVSAAEVTDQNLPRLLQADGWRCFDQLCLYDGQPYLKLQVGGCYAGGALE